MEYYGANDWRDYLAHYGVKGMKWDKHLKAKEEIRPLGLRGRTAQMVNPSGLRTATGPGPVTSMRTPAGAIRGAGGSLGIGGANGSSSAATSTKRVGDGPYMSETEVKANIAKQRAEIKKERAEVKKEAKKEAKKALDKKGKEKASGAGESVYRNRKAISRALDKAGASGKTKSGVEKSVPAKVRQEIERSKSKKGVPAKVRQEIERSKNKKSSVTSTTRRSSSKASSRVAKSVSNVISNAKRKISNAQSGKTRTNRQRLGRRQRV